MTKLKTKVYDVDLSGKAYGQLKLDHEQGVWILWPESIDDGVTYTRDLDETVAIIAGELGAGWVAVRGSNIDLITDAADVPTWVPGKVLPGKVTYTDGIEGIEAIQY